MSYNVHNFRTGETIEAPPINEMDEQIRSNEEAIASLAEKIDVLDLDATAADVGKALIVKTVSGGKVTAYEFGDAGAPSATGVYF